MKHVIRVVFQNKSMYAHTWFRGVQNWKKGKFLAMFINFEKKMAKKFLKACKNTYLGSIFMDGKYVFRVCFESPFLRMISSLKYKWPLEVIPLSMQLLQTLCQLHIEL